MTNTKQHKMDNGFLFIPAQAFDIIFKYQIPVTFHGSSTCYYQTNGVKYIIYDGFHIATKYQKKITWNPNFSLPAADLKKAIQSL